jgi:uncharacterized protein
VNREIPICISTTNGLIRGILHQPCDVYSKKMLIIVHGYFMSHRIGPARLYVTISRDFANCGYHVVRYDAFGFGESDGDYRDVTYSSTLDSLICICDWVRNELNIQPVILGHSMGANIAMRAVAESLVKCSGLICLAPDSMLLLEGDSENSITVASDDPFFNKQHGLELKTVGFTYRVGLKHRSEFIYHIREIAADLLAEKMPVPLVVIQSRKDDKYHIEEAYKIAKAATNGLMIELPEGDHNFITSKGILTLREPLEAALQYIQQIVK